jgi:hypothetical protein
MFVSEAAGFLCEKFVCFESGRLDVGVEGLADLEFGVVEFDLERGFVVCKFFVEGLAELSGASSDFGVERSSVSVEAFFDHFGELLVDCVFAGLIGQTCTRVSAEVGFLGINPDLEARV